MSKLDRVMNFEISGKAPNTYFKEFPTTKIKDYLPKIVSDAMIDDFGYSVGYISSSHSLRTNNSNKEFLIKNRAVARLLLDVKNNMKVEDTIVNEKVTARLGYYHGVRVLLIIDTRKDIWVEPVLFFHLKYSEYIGSVLYGFMKK